MKRKEASILFHRPYHHVKNICYAKEKKNENELLFSEIRTRII